MNGPSLFPFLAFLVICPATAPAQDALDDLLSPDPEEGREAADGAEERPEGEDRRERSNDTAERSEPKENAGEPAPDALPPAPVSGRRVVEEIVVTATKRAESLRDLPVTIDAFTGAELVERGAIDLEEIVKLSPGTSKNQDRVVIRGVSASAIGAVNLGEEVGRLFGDTSLNAPSTRGALADLDPYDMRTVEVLKGPQGTLHGGSALSGAVRYVPNAPSFEGLAAGLRIGGGPTAHSDELNREAAFMANGSFADSVALRIVGSRRERAGILDDVAAGTKDFDDRTTTQGRVLAAWRPLDSLDVDFTFLSWKDVTSGALTDRPDRYETRVKRTPEPSIMKNRLVSLRTEYAFEPFSLVGVASLLETSWFLGVDLAPLLGTQDLPAETFVDLDARARIPSFEIRLVSSRPSGGFWWILNGWDYLAGVFVMEARQEVDSVIHAARPLPSPLPSISEVADDQRARTDAEELAFFFDTTRAFFGWLELHLGGRLARTSTDNVTVRRSGGQQVDRFADGTKGMRFNPKVGLTWRMADSFSLYFSAAEGFRFGGVNVALTAGLPADEIPRTFESDTLWNYELGMRSDWLDDLVQLDVAAYRIDWTDMQIVQVSDTAQNFVANVGGARILGVEANVAGTLPAGFSLGLRGSYIDPRTTEFFESSNGPVEKGSRLPLTPYVSLNPALDWTGAWGEWILNASISDAYSGSSKNELINTFTLPAFHSLGAAFSVVLSDLPFSPALSVSGTNLLDQAVPHFAFPQIAGDETVFVLSTPRTVLSSLTLSF